MNAQNHTIVALHVPLGVKTPTLLHFILNSQHNSGGYNVEQSDVNENLSEMCENVRMIMTENIEHAITSIMQNAFKLSVIPFQRTACAKK